MIATIVKHQWFSGSPLPLNEWFGRNHWYQWFFNGFWSINHWPRCFFSLATIGLDGFAMVFGLATIGLDGFSMVANHWSNDGMVTIHRSGLCETLIARTTLVAEEPPCCKNNQKVSKIRTHPQDTKTRSIKTAPYLDIHGYILS